METSSVTSKHQITIPSKVRRFLGLRKGDRLSFQVEADGSCSVRKLSIRKSDGAAKSFLAPGTGPLSDEKMKEAIRKGALESYRERNR